MSCQFPSPVVYFMPDLIFSSMPYSRSMALKCASGVASFAMLMRIFWVLFEILNPLLFTVTESSASSGATMSVIDSSWVPTPVFLKSVLCTSFTAISFIESP